jgi:hypothetical protein
MDSIADPLYVNMYNLVAALMGSVLLNPIRAKLDLKCPSA